MLGFFRPAPDAPEQPASRIAQLFERWRLSVFLSITLGYTVFYVTRLSTSVSKDAMIGSGVITIGQAGLIDSAFLITYAVGKTVNGFLADRVSARRFFATALLISALGNLAFGVSSTFIVFVLLWSLNGWVQSVGVPTSGVVMSSWFGPRELGTRYSIWSLAHHFGEGLTFLFSAHLIGAATTSGAGADAWRAAFLGPGMLGLVTAFVLYRTLADRPQAVGLPSVATYHGEVAVTARPQPISLRSLQLGVLKNPAILLCGVASGLIYVSRYAMNNWGVYYLQHEYGFSVEQAGSALATFPIAGIGGTLLAGPISDRLTGGRRVPVAVVYGLVFCASLAAFYSADAGSAVLIRVTLACAGFAMGGLLVFLGGLIAMELVSKRAAGAALGVIGGFSYLGAAMQSVVSGYVIERGRTIDHGLVIHDFTAAKWVWLGAPCLAVVLTALLWRAERRVKPRD